MSDAARGPRGPLVLELPGRIDTLDAAREIADRLNYAQLELERLLQAIAERCRPAGVKARMSIALTHIDEQAVHQAAADNEAGVVRSSTGAIGFMRPMGSPRSD